MLRSYLTNLTSECRKLLRIMSNNPPEQNEATDDKSFADILNEFESSTQGKAPRDPGSPLQKAGEKANLPPRSSLRGTVVGISGDYVLIDHGAKSEGMIPRCRPPGR